MDMNSMSTATTASMAGSSMPSSTGMIMSSTTHMPMSMMDMTFFESTSTPLFSMSWTPSTIGAYVGTCIFLIVLAIILHALYAVKSIAEARWHAEDLRRRYVVTHAKRGPSIDVDGPDEGYASSSAGSTRKTPRARTAVLTTNGLNESVQLVQNTDAAESIGAGATPWRLSVDLPRALLITVMAGVGYLLMLAVMTMNVGYFMSVLAGSFVGGLFLGRYSTHAAGH